MSASDPFAPLATLAELLEWADDEEALPSETATVSHELALAVARELDQLKG